MYANRETQSQVDAQRSLHHPHSPTKEADRIKHDSSHHQ